MDALIVGAGYWGTVLYNNILGLNNRDITKYSRIVTYDPNVLIKSDYKNLNEIDLENILDVYIATPVSTHYELCKFFLENNINVFCEKAPHYSKKKLFELHDLAKANKKLFFINWIYNYNGGYQALLKENTEDVFMWMLSTKSRSHVKDTDIFGDMAIHAISLDNSDPLSLHIYKDTFNYIRGYIKFSSGVTADFACGWNQPENKRCLEIGNMSFDDISQSVYLSDKVYKEIKAPLTTLEYTITNFLTYDSKIHTANFDTSLRAIDLLTLYNKQKVMV